MEKKIDIIGQIQDHIDRCGGFDTLNAPITFNLWCGGKDVDVTFLSVVDVMKGVCTYNDTITEVTHEIYAIDTKGEIWNIDDFLNDDRLLEVLEGLKKERVSVKLEVEVTFDVDKDSNVNTNEVYELARQMVGDKLEYDLNTCYGKETFVDYNVEISED
jgi:hypothetical protein